MTNIFAACKTLDELKKAYKAAALKNHPDLGGNTREHKDALKAAGCRWCSTKKLWSWHFADEGCGYRKGRRSTMDQIRSKYGSTTFSRSATSDALPA